MTHWSQNDLVPTLQLFSQHRNARVFPSLGRRRNRGNPFRSDATVGHICPGAPDENHDWLAQSEWRTQSGARKIARLIEQHRGGETPLGTAGCGPHRRRLHRGMGRSPRSRARRHVAPGGGAHLLRGAAGDAVRPAAPPAHPWLTPLRLLRVRVAAPGSASEHPRMASGSEPKATHSTL
jgi:hypothetical protein